MPAVVDLAAMRDAIARPSAATRRDQPADPGRARDRPLGAGRRVRLAPRLRPQRRARGRAQPRALRVPALGPGARSPTSRSCRRAPGSVHQVNLEYLARVVEIRDGVAFPDTVVGLDSHTTMVNGLGVLGWGVGGIEAEAAMLGEPLSMLVPQVVGFRLRGRLREGATATDLVLTATELLRRTGVVGKFVEYFGEGVSTLTVADRATLGNMSPEYGATCGYFPVDELTLDYLRLTGRPAAQRRARRGLLPREPALARAGRASRSTRRSSSSTSARSSRRSRARAGRRTACRSPGRRSRSSTALAELRRRPRNGTDEGLAETFPASDPTTEQAPGARPGAAPRRRGSASRGRAAAAHGPGHDRRRGARARPRRRRDRGDHLVHEHLEPAGDGRRRPAREEGGRARAPPGAVGEDLARPGLAGRHRLLRARRPADASSTTLGFNTVGYGCTTCIGNSGPLAPEISAAIAEGDLVACAVLSGNRNFEARIHPEVKANYLASPPLVVAYALAGRIDVDVENEPLAQHAGRRDVFLRDLWPSSAEIQAAIASSVAGRDVHAHLRRRLHGRRDLARPASPRAATATTGTRDSTYVRRPPYFDGLDLEPGRARRHRGRALPRLARRLGHDRPHLARRRDQARLAGRPLPDRARRRAGRLQLLRRPPRQPRGDGARHVRERAPAEPARPRLGGHLDAAPARRARR